MRHLCLSLLLLALVTVSTGNTENTVENHEVGEGGRPYVNALECPRKPELLAGRKCMKKCRSDDDCRGRRKRCLCDDVCGKSCVKDSRPCEPLTDIENGHVEIIPKNKFGARAIYSCKQGYSLGGSRERLCGGGGKWSGQAPVCHTQGVCRDPLEVSHAFHDGPPGQTVFPLGMQLTYDCSSGYHIEGYVKAMCVGEGRWVGPRITCSPTRCNHPGDIAHGYRDGSMFMYPHKVTYRCAEGYNLQGTDARVCQHDGQWSGSLPRCIPVECTALHPPPNGNLRVVQPGMANTFGAEVEFSCNSGFQLRGSRTRLCLQNGSWGGEPASCPVMDCGVPGPFYNGDLIYTHTTFGSTIQFRCRGRTTFHGESANAICQADGNWSNPPPACYSKCAAEGISHGFFSNSSVTRGTLFQHGDPLGYSCHAGHVLNTQQLPSCNNGTWSLLPQCMPAPCRKRPPDLDEGMVRYYTSNHGDQAKYSCHTGFKLSGSMFLTCQYGNWTGQPPQCEPVFCPFPGDLENGQILLVGVLGKYEYRDYVRDVGHNKEIQFHCNKGYKPVGPSGATCVDGVWSPEPSTKCVRGQHPKLSYLLRGRREAEGLIQTENRGLAYS